MRSRNRGRIPRRFFLRHPLRGVAQCFPKSSNQKINLMSGCGKHTWVAIWPGPQRRAKASARQIRSQRCIKRATSPQGQPSARGDTSLASLPQRSLPSACRNAGSPGQKKLESGPDSGTGIQYFSIPVPIPGAGCRSLRSHEYSAL